MNLLENIKEGFRTVKENLLRAILTALIIAIGITSLVGILTAIDSMEHAITGSFSELGANAFDIRSKGYGHRYRHQGRSGKTYPPVDLLQARAFKKQYDFNSKTSVYTYISQIAEIKSLSRVKGGSSRKTNPNVSVIGIDENFLDNKDYDLLAGRNFSNIELKYGSNVAIIGNEIANVLFEVDLGETGKSDGKVPPSGGFRGVKTIQLLGKQYHIIGILKKRGSLTGGKGADRLVLIPIENSRHIATGRQQTNQINIKIKNSVDLDYAMGEATGVMRYIRRDLPGEEDSFELTKSDTLAAALEDISGYLRIGGFLIGFVTLIGAAVALMNIMMVSVTERTREIGIRKALGATPWLIRQQFLIEAIIICQLGGIAGIIFGIIIGNIVPQLIGAGAFVIPWLWIITGLTVCVVVGILSGYYPAYKASKVDPIESLRFE